MVSKGKEKYEIMAEDVEEVDESVELTDLEDNAANQLIGKFKLRDYYEYKDLCKIVDFQEHYYLFLADSPYKDPLSFNQEEESDITLLREKINNLRDAIAAETIRKEDGKQAHLFTDRAEIDTRYYDDMHWDRTKILKLALY